jgi:hypothetical protein
MPLMRWIAMAAAVSLILLLPTPATVSAQTAAKKMYVPDCGKQENALAKAREARAGLRLDLGPCKALTGANRTKCERPIRDAYNQAMRAAREAETAAKKALTCCQRPATAGCGSTYIR